MNIGERCKCYSTLWKKAEKDDNIKMGIKVIDCDGVSWQRIKPIRNSVVTKRFASKRKKFFFTGF
jgi:hypothetical protein